MTGILKGNRELSKPRALDHLASTATTTTIAGFTDYSSSETLEPCSSFRRMTAAQATEEGDRATADEAP